MSPALQAGELVDVGRQAALQVGEALRGTVSSASAIEVIEEARAVHSGR